MMPVHDRLVADACAGGFDADAITLDPHQTETAAALLEPGRRELFAAMDMGTGKTLTAIAAACAWRARAPGAAAIVVCPAALIHTVWSAECRRALGDEGSFQVIDGELPASFEPGMLYIISYTRVSNLFRAGWFKDPEGEDYVDKQGRHRKRAAWLRRGGSPLLEHPWGLVVFDESHHLRNPDRLIIVGNACERLTRSASRVLLLTGTPVQNRPEDISGQLRAASSSSLLTDPKQISVDGSIPYAAIEALKPLIRRVTYEDTGRTLPPKDLRTVTVDHGITGPMLTLYNTTLQEAQQLVLTRPDEGSGLADALRQIRQKLITLRTIALEPSFIDYHGQRDKRRKPTFNAKAAELTADAPGAKLRKALEITNELLGRHDKVVVTCESVSLLIVLQHLFKRQTGEAPLLFDGSLNARAKDETVRRFLSESGQRVLLLSLVAGGEGLNLVPGPTAMVVLSTWYNPAKHRQVEARIHRRGQDKPVEIRHVLSGCTIDEAILATHTDKKRCADLILGDFYDPQEGDSATTWKKLGRIVNYCRPLKPLAGADESVELPAPPPPRLNQAPAPVPQPPPTRRPPALAQMAGINPVPAMVANAVHMSGLKRPALKIGSLAPAPKCARMMEVSRARRPLSPRAKAKAILEAQRTGRLAPSPAPPRPPPSRPVNRVDLFSLIKSVRSSRDQSLVNCN